MLNNLQFNFRKEKEGPENDLVNTFLNQYTHNFEKKNYKFKILKEVYAETGIPDILIVVWEDVNKSDWSPKRNKLDKTDIKILHHISSNGKRGIRFKRILQQLGYSEKSAQKSLKKLVQAELIFFNGMTARIKDFENSFFVREIISIEAKMSDWKNAFKQAQLNENFSSHSYVLLPDKTITENVVSSINGNLGIFSQSEDGAKLKVRAKKAKLPGSYFSWIINEYIGRQLASAL